MRRALSAAILLIAGTLAHAEPRSWDDLVRARAEELATRASERFEEVMNDRRLIDINETSMLLAFAVAIGRVTIIGVGDAASEIPLAD